MIGQPLDVRLTSLSVEVFHQRQRVAIHVRSDKRGAFTTVAAHLPSPQQLYLQEWTPGRFLTWAIGIGPHTRDLVRAILNSRTNPLQAYRSCFGLLGLTRRFGQQRLEAACQRALALGLPTRKSVLSILQKGLDQAPLPHPEPAADLPAHANIRGADYYQQLLFSEGESRDAHSTNPRHFTQPETDRDGAGLPAAAGTTTASSTPV